MKNKRKQAVALKYNQMQNQLPKVRASGKGLIAEEIIRKAKESNVPIIKDPSLVELLSELNINEAIPEELYEVVAEVFVYIYRLDERAVLKEKNDD